MKILFTTKDSLFSKLIRDITEEPVSHVALQFPLGMVLHSNYKGVNIEFIGNFKKNNLIIKELVAVSDLLDKENEQKLKDTLNKEVKIYYDSLALLFIGISLVARKWLKIPLPKSNLWDVSGMDICTEWVSRWIYGKADNMITPYKLYCKLKNTGEWVDG